MSWSFQKTHLVTIFLNPENRSFENVSIVTFRQIFDISLLNNLFISFFNLFISLTESNSIKELSLKENSCNFKIDKITYS